MFLDKDKFIEAVLTLILIAGVILGFSIGYEFFIIIPFTLITIILFNKSKKARLMRMSKERLKNQWGKDQFKKRHITNIRKLYDFMSPEREDDFVIDDITWRDLNMDSIFGKIDHTKSMPGMNYLYNILRNPMFHKEPLLKRNSLVDSFKKNKDISVEIQYPLTILGNKDNIDIFSYFQNGLNVKTNKLILYRILSILSIAAAVLLIFNRQFGFPIYIGIVSINSIFYQSNKNNLEREIGTFRYLGNLIRCLDNISNIDIEGIDIGKNKIKALLKATNRIHKNISKLNDDGRILSEMQIVMEYINMVTLREAIIFYSTVKLIDENRENFIEIYKAVGKLDAYISIASYKESLEYYTEPSFIEENDTAYLYVEKIYHPLLDNPVPYTFELKNKGILVTGSNASGKSTYLRTIGINALFAQTMFFTLGEQYHANYFKILSSIGTIDSIEDGDSYFMTEAKSLKRIIDSLDSEYPILCILDEIFRGTNTVERINAALEVLDYMVQRNSLVIAATHDLELTSMAEDNFYNYHFQEKIKEHDIEFDYILRKGPCTSRNAIAILRYLGYPEAIYENAYKRVGKYESEN